MAEVPPGPAGSGERSPEARASGVPQPVAAAAELMAGFPGTWALCGGWAVDAWVGEQTRDHVDVDLAISADDQPALHGYLRDGWLLNGHDPSDDDSTHQWDGHRLELPAHIHARGHGHELDVQLETREGDVWVLLQAPRVELPMDSCIRSSAWDLPTLAPEVILLFKAAETIRPHDAADFELLLPVLSPKQRAWLTDAITALRADHEWLSSLAAG